MVLGISLVERWMGQPSGYLGLCMKVKRGVFLALFRECRSVKTFTNLNLVLQLGLLSVLQNLQANLTVPANCPGFLFQDVFICKIRSREVMERSY